MKKFLAILLTAALFISALSVVAYAQPAQGLRHATFQFEERYGDFSAARRQSRTLPATNDYINAQKAILNGLNSLQEQIDLTKYNIAETDIEELLYTAVFNDPLFYLFYTGGYDVNASGRVTVLYIDYLLDQPDLAAAKEALQGRFNDALDTLDSKMSQAEKVLALHDFLVLNTNYDLSSDNLEDLPIASFSAFGVFGRGIAVCEGYAHAMNHLLREAGMDSVMATNEEINHAWNMVKVDGQWYNVDATWDDPVTDGYGDGCIEGYVGHDYLLLSDAELERRGHLACDNLNIQATSTKYNAYGYQDIYTGMFYHSGYWYYLTDQGLLKSKMDMSSKSVVKAMNAYEHQALGAYGGKLYYNTKTQIMEINYDGSGQRAVLDIAARHRLTNAGILEMGLYRNIAVYGVYDYNTGKYYFSSYNITTGAVITIGDASGDGAITITDAMLALNAVTGKIQLSEQERVAADVNGDGSITITDALLILNFVTGKIYQF